MASPGTTILRSVLRDHRGVLALTWTLYGIELIAGLARPYLLGSAVDGMLAGHYRGFTALVAAHLVYLVVGAARHMVDTRAFSGVYRSFVTRLVTQPDPAISLSRRSGLSVLTREMTDFLQYDVNYVVEALYNIIGSLLVMLLYDRIVAAICLGVLVPVTLTGRWYSTRAARLNREQYDELEQQVDVLGSNDPPRIAAHYDALRRTQVRLSDLEAANWGATELSVLVILSAALLLSTEPGALRLPVGAIVALYSYVQRFASGLETIPYTLQRVSALRDILRRVDDALATAQ
ncbi:MAG: ABC transporter six-transmembrane domain-containing protein [Gemmatimonadaceae bacterium]|nr:ABC transporter six-transmembrane domain-containing protein [Gemmatimonadaceae bacterium]